MIDVDNIPSEYRKNYASILERTERVRKIRGYKYGVVSPDSKRVTIAKGSESFSFKRVCWSFQLIDLESESLLSAKARLYFRLGDGSTKPFIHDISGDQRCTKLKGANFRRPHVRVNRFTRWAFLMYGGSRITRQPIETFEGASIEETLSFT